MKKIILALTMMVLTTSVYATPPASTTTTASLVASTQAAAGAIGSITSNSGNVAGTDLGQMVPAVSAPGLATTLTETY